MSLDYEVIGMNASDKRRARRFPMNLPVRIKTEGQGDHEAAVQTKDISSSGIYFEFSTPLDLGTPLEFVLTLPEEITKGNAVQIRCMGKVVRVIRGDKNEASIGIAATIERYEFLRSP